MVLSYLGPDPVETAVARVLGHLAAGEAPRDVEERLVDVKEEAGRRSRTGAVKPGQRQNEAAATHLAEEMACLANTDGGGAIILGISDLGKRIGTKLSIEWLRHRVFELTGGMVTPAIRELEMDGVRLLVLSTGEAVEPVRYKGRIKWRVSDNCVEVDALTWHTQSMRRRGVDWSAQPSGHGLDDVSPSAVEVARRHLREVQSASASPAHTVDLAEAGLEDFIRRLDLVDGKNRLTNAGALLFVATPVVGIDYIRRDFAGGDSVLRIESTDPLIVQVDEVIRAVGGFNRVTHVRTGPGEAVHLRRRALPVIAAREAIVNGVAHRDWHSPDPTLVEHIDDMLIVSSPGGFIGGITAENIITHPPKPRYRSLAAAMATLGLGEREGIGVDRMVGAMLASGHSKPVIVEITGPYVRVTLFGGHPDRETIEFLTSLEPAALAGDVEILMLLDLLCRRGWVDARTAAPELQRRSSEMNERLDRLCRVRLDGKPIVAPVKGVPRSAPPAYRLAAAARARLFGRLAPLSGREAHRDIAMEWAEARGRVSSTELSDLTGVHTSTAGRMLNALADEGLLTASSDVRGGRGFHYMYAATAQDAIPGFESPGANS